MPMPLEYFERELIHDLINLHVFPECHLRLGQYDHCRFEDADIVWERTGNPYSCEFGALSYCYNISGPGFELCLTVSWYDDFATVKVVSISPDDEVAYDGLRSWLRRVVTGRRPPRNPSDGLGLR